MKVGDKLYTRSDIKITIDSFISLDYFTLGDISTIISIDSYPWLEEPLITFKNDLGEIYYLHSCNNNLYDYFYTEQEIRKMKLEKINENML